MAHAYRELLLEEHNLLPHKMAQDEKEAREKLSQAKMIFAKSHARLWGQRQTSEGA
jgi:hypothetical protein